MEMVSGYQYAHTPAGVRPQSKAPPFGVRFARRLGEVVD